MITKQKLEELIKQGATIYEAKEFGNVTKEVALKFPSYNKVEIYMDNMKKFGLNRNDRVLAEIII